MVIANPAPQIQNINLRFAKSLQQDVFKVLGFDACEVVDIKPRESQRLVDERLVVIAVRIEFRSAHCVSYGHFFHGGSSDQSCLEFTLVTKRIHGFPESGMLIGEQLAILCQISRAAPLPRSRIHPRYNRELLVAERRSRRLSIPFPHAASPEISSTSPRSLTSRMPNRPGLGTAVIVASFPCSLCAAIKLSDIERPTRRHHRSYKMSHPRQDRAPS